MQGMEGFIRNTVFSFAKLRSGYDRNRVLIPDMLQESRLAVLLVYREFGDSLCRKDITYYHAITKACRKVLMDSSNVRLPEAWFKYAKHKPDRETYHAQSIEGMLAMDMDIADTSDSLDDMITTRVLIEDVLRLMRPKEQESLTLIGWGFTPTEIEVMTGTSTRSLYYYLQKARKMIEEGKLQPR